MIFPQNSIMIFMVDFQTFHCLPRTDSYDEETSPQTRDRVDSSSLIDLLGDSNLSRVHRLPQEFFGAKMLLQFL